MPSCYSVANLREIGGRKRREQAKTSRSERPRRRHLDDGSFARLPPVIFTILQKHKMISPFWSFYMTGIVQIVEILPCGEKEPTDLPMPWLFMSWRRNVSRPHRHGTPLMCSEHSALSTKTVCGIVRENISAPCIIVIVWFEINTI